MTTQATLTPSTNPSFTTFEHPTLAIVTLDASDSRFPAALKTSCTGQFAIGIEHEPSLAKLYGTIRPIIRLGMNDTIGTQSDNLVENLSKAGVHVYRSDDPIKVDPLSSVYQSCTPSGRTFSNKDKPYLNTTLGERVLRAKILFNKEAESWNKPDSSGPAVFNAFATVFREAWDAFKDRQASS